MDECREYIAECFDMLKQVVEQFIRCHSEKEKTTFFGFLHKVLSHLDQRKVSPEYTQYLFEQIRLVDSADYNEETFHCFKSIFKLHNDGRNKATPGSIGRVSPKEMDSYEVIELLIKRHHSDRVAQLAIEYYFELHAKMEGADVLLDILVSLEAAVKGGQDLAAARLINMVNCLIDESEKEGFHAVSSLISFTKDENFVLNVFCEEYYSNYNKKYEIPVSSNLTLFQLKERIAAMSSFTFKEIRPCFKKELADRYHCWTLRELGIGQGDSMQVTKRGYEYSVRESLIFENKEINPKAVRIFEAIFTRFSTDGLMSKEQCRDFTCQCVGFSSYNDERINGIYREYDGNKDGFLERKEFVDFYIKASQDKPSTVWDNLRNLGVSSDLTFPEEMSLPCGFTQLPRETLANNETLFDLLFSMLDKPKAAGEAWRLLQRLPPSKVLIAQVETPSVFNCDGLAPILDLRSPYRLEYILILLEIKLADDSPYLEQFIEQGGLKQLLLVLAGIGLCSEKAHKALKLSLLKLIRDLFLAGTDSEQVTRGQAILRGDYTIDEIINIIEKEELITQKIRHYEEQPHKEENKELKRFFALFKKFKEFRLDKGLGREDLRASVQQAVGEAGLLGTLLEGLRRKELEPELAKQCGLMLCGYLLVEEQLADTHLAELTAILRGPHEDHLCLVMLVVSMLSQKSSGRLVASLAEMLVPKPASMRFYSLLAIAIRKHGEKPDIGGLLLGYLEQERDEHLVYGILRVLKELRGIQGATRMWRMCLFGEDIICKASESRKLAYDLVVNICRQYPAEGRQLCREHIVPMSLSLPAFPERLLASWNHPRSHYGYAGIHNPRAICYMISMLQQFFMIPPFRHGILLADDGLPPNPAEHKGQAYDDNVLHQLQAIYTRLLTTARKDVHISDFCLSFKDWEGQPVDVTVQQDAFEFLNRILDALERALKPTPYEHLLDSIFGGRICNITECEDCGFTNRNYENILNLSLEVRGRKNLYDSLSKLTSEERISDFKCEQCKKKVTIKKRTLLEEGPSVLIMHLQRIVFNFDILINEKINSRLEFPLDINLTPYSTQQDGQDFEYRLTGIVCHNGTAEYGHYYSFIEVQPDYWLEFNDSTIRQFSKNSIETHCFGGILDDDDWKKEEITHSAYMLFYEKSKKKKLKIVEQLAACDVAEEDKELFLKKSPSGTECEFIRKPVERDYHSLELQLDPRLAEQVSEDNKKFELEKFLLSNSFNTFLVNYFTSCWSIEEADEAGLKETFFTLLRYVFKLFVKSPDPEDLEIIDLVKLITGLIERCPQLCEHSLEFIDFSSEKLEDEPVVQMLVASTEEQLRASASLLLSKTVTVILGECDEGRRAMVVQFLLRLLELLPTYVAKNWTKFNSYFGFWQALVEQSQEIERLFLAENMPVKLLDYFMEKKSPLRIYSSKKHSFDSKYQSPNFGALFRLAMHFIRNFPEQVNQKQLQEFVECTDFVEKLLGDKGGLELLLFFTVENKDFSEALCLHILRGLDRPDSLEDTCFTMGQVLRVDDSLRGHRLRMVVGYWQVSGLKADSTPKCIYESALGIDYKSCLLDYLTKSRMRNESSYMAVARAFLELMADPFVKGYVTSQPSHTSRGEGGHGPNYFHFFEGELGLVQDEIRKYMGSHSKRMETFEQLKAFWLELKAGLLHDTPVVAPLCSSLLAMDDKTMTPLDSGFFLKEEEEFSVLVYKNKYSEYRVSVKLLEGTAEELEEGRGEVIVFSKMMRYVNYSALFSTVKRIRLVEHHLEKERDSFTVKTRLLRMI